MLKVMSLLVLSVSAGVAAATLTGCSVGPLPGAPLGPSASTVSSAAAAATMPSAQPAPSSSSSSSSGVTSLPTQCPDAGLVSKLAGLQLPAPTVAATSLTLSCTYVGSSSSDALQMAFRTASPDTDAAGIKAEMENDAPTIKVKTVVTALPGYGQAAYTIYGTKAAGILVWNKGVVFSINDNDTLPGLERVAKGLLDG